MKMSSQSRYGLRAMVAIARSPRGPSRSEQLAEKEGGSKKYLDAILGTLREGGLLRTVRGPGGGYVLARPAARISAADVVQALEGKIALVRCLEQPGSCERQPRCPTRRVWRVASEAVRSALEGLTLEELAAGRAPKRRRPRRARTRRGPP
jgi:Rrf2 family protein